MIRHIVLLDLPSGYDQDELAEIMDGIHALRETITGFTRFEHGVNRDFENMSEDCANAFSCHFLNEDASHRYINDPDHQALGSRLVRMCRDGVQGIKVIDMELAA